MSKLYIVATPIGNLEDVTLRALRVLREVDFILCEDTRITKRLLARHDVATKTISYHQHSKNYKVDSIIKLLQDDKDLALVTDAGTPGISDPGGKLVSEVIKNVSDVEVVAIPGPSAVTALLSVSGLPTDSFLFLGFLPHKKGRQTAVREALSSKRTVVLYESVHRITKLLNEIIDNNGSEVQLVVGRELTKKFESIYRGTPAEVLATLDEVATNIKGEFVVIISRNA